MSNDDDNPGFRWGFVFGAVIVGGLALFLFWLNEPFEGNERGKCYGNSTCNKELVCASERCVKLPAADAGAER